MEEVVINEGDSKGVMGLSCSFLVFGDKIGVFFIGWWNGGVVWVVIDIVRGVKELDIGVFG